MNTIGNSEASNMFVILRKRYASPVDIQNSAALLTVAEAASLAEHSELTAGAKGRDDG